MSYKFEVMGTNSNICNEVYRTYDSLCEAVDAIVLMSKYSIIVNEMFDAGRFMSRLSIIQLDDNGNIIFSYAFDITIPKEIDIDQPNFTDPDQFIEYCINNGIDADEIVRYCIIAGTAKLN